MEILLENLINKGMIFILRYSPIILKKVFFLLILFFSCNLIKKKLFISLERILNNRKIDELLVDFLFKVINLLIILFYILTILDVIGLKIVSVLGLFGSVSIAIGLALKGCLTDIASGIQLLISKPFKKGDYIITKEVEGIVQNISFLSTILNSGDNKKIIIPNAKLSISVITTVTSNSHRRADFLFLADKKCNLEKVKEILFNIVNDHPFVLKDKEIFIKFVKETSVSTEFLVRVWTLKENFRDLNSDIQEEVKKRFDMEGIRKPFYSSELPFICIKT